jgi:phosphate transport system substrate-binding protein
MLPKKDTSIAFLTLIFALAALPKPIEASTRMEATIAQSNAASDSFSLPESIPEGTKVQINGSSSMAAINQLLKQDFEGKYSGTEVRVNYAGNEAALQALQEGKIDLAAIGRPLTEAEKSEGLVEVSLKRHKIAIVVGSENPFNGNLTIDRFVKIFRGEIKDWSEVGGSPGEIRPIDRPESTDTRQAFGKYSVFENGSLSSGENATKIEEDSIEAAIAKLGKDGITYAIANQVIDRPGVRVVSMYQTTPDNPKYPFSQPLYYIYKGPAPSPAVEAFLAYATAPSTQEAIAEAKLSEYPPVPASNTSTNTDNPSGTTLLPNSSTDTNTDAAKGTPSWLWWLVPVAILGGLLAWLALKNRGSQPETLGTTPDSMPPVPPAVPTPPPIPGEGIAAAPLGVAGATATNEENIATTTEGANPVALGAAGATAAALGAAGIAGAGLFGAAAARAKPESRLILVPRNSEDLYAYWEVPDELNEDLKQQGGNNLKLRLYDVTDIEVEGQKPEMFEQFDCDELDRDLHLPIQVSDRDYMGELGYTTDDDRWLPIASSAPVKVPAGNPVESAIQGGGIAIAGIGAAAAAGSLFQESDNLPDTEIKQADLDFTDRNFIEPETETTSDFLAQTDEIGSNLSAPETESTSDVWDGDTEIWDGTTQTTSDFLAEESEIPSDFSDEELETSSNLFEEETTSDFLAETDEIGSDLSAPETESTSDVWDGDTEIWNGTTQTTSDFLAEESEIPSDFSDEELETSSDLFAEETETPSEFSFADEELETNSGLFEEETETTSDFLNESSETTFSFADEELETNSGLFEEETETFSDFLNESSETTFSFSDEDLETSSDLFAEETETTSNFLDELTEMGSQAVVGASGVAAGIGATIPSFVADENKTTTESSSRIILIAGNENDAYAYWEVPQEHKDRLKQQGGKKLALRLYDVTDIDPNIQQPQMCQEFDCEELEPDLHLPTVSGDRDYLVELGYVTEDGRWLMLTRSLPIRVPTV